MYPWVGIEIQIKNTGQSPNIKGTVGLYFYLMGRSTMQYVTSSNIPSINSGETESVFCSFNLEKYPKIVTSSDLSSGGCYAEIRGLIKYTDVFGVRHESDFSCKAEPIPKKDWPSKYKEGKYETYQKLALTFKSSYDTPQF